MKRNFFLEHPVFSIVISIVIFIIGGIGLAMLPVDQYPQIVPPVVKITASYPGADAQTVTQAVATPIEQELNGTPGMIYMSSSSSNSGGFSALVTFDIDTDPELAAVDIQNRVKKAESRLPAEVVQNGISVSKETASRLMTITILSSDPKFDEVYLSNYTTLNVLDPLRRIPGVGSVSNVGSRYYAMQIWVAPDKLADLGLTVKDIQSALKDQNRESAAGVLGQAPATDIDLTMPIIARGRLSTVAEFEDIVIRADANGSIIRLKDVARVSLEASSYSTESGINGGNAAVLNINMLPGSNAMEVADAVKKRDGNHPPKVSPEGITYEIPFRHDHLYIRVDPSCVPDILRGTGAGDPCGVPVVAKLAFNPHPHHCCADIACRDFRRDAYIRILAQHAHSARTYSRHRHSGGRRHSGGGECGPHNEH